MLKFRSNIEKSALLASLLLLAMPVSQAQQVNLGLTENATTGSYSMYQIIDDASIHPGMGLRYKSEQGWFLYSETHHATAVPLTQEPRLFRPDEPRTILIGGGITF